MTMFGYVVNSGCIIGANAVYRLKNSEKNCIYGGIPAKLIKKETLNTLTCKAFLCFLGKCYNT